MSWRGFFGFMIAWFFCAWLAQGVYDLQGVWLFVSGGLTGVIASSVSNYLST